MVQDISEFGIGFIRRWEELRVVPYRDTNGHWTCGFGHLLGREPFSGETWTMAQAKEVLVSDLANAAKPVRDLNIGLTQPQFDALCSLVFNIGSGNFAKSAVRAALFSGLFHDAANAFLHWNDNGHGEKRREEERVLFLYGTI